MFCFSYSPQNGSITTLMEIIDKFIDLLSAKYEIVTLIYDLVSDNFDTSVDYFCYICCFKIWIKEAISEAAVQKCSYKKVF